MSKPERIQKTEDVFSELGRIGKIEKLPICIVVVQHYYGWQADIDRLKKLASKYGLYAVDTGTAFKNTIRSEYTIYKLDGHPNAEANGIFAKVIYSCLKEHKLLGNN